MVKSEKQRKHLEKINKNQKRENNRNWKGGVMITGGGYIALKTPYHPRANRGYVFEHILVMEKAINRFLEDNEIVHHINGNKKDNRLKNLRLMSPSEHCALHNKLRGGKENRSL